MTSVKPPTRHLAAATALAALGLLACGRLDMLGLSAIGLGIPSHGESPVQVFKLKNGLTVLIKESHANPIVTLDVWVNTGSFNEPPELNGVSHFLEHMLFKGTKRRPVGQIDLEIESVGGETNAGTSKDFTHYYVTVASDYVATGLDVLADVMMNSTLDEREIERERMVILEEYRRKQDSPFGLLYDLVCETAYRSGPYKQSVLGTTATITSLTRSQLLDYYRRYYTPDNMVLVIVGDVETEKILPLVRRYFGRYRRSKRPFDNLNTRTRWAGPTTRIVEKDVRDTYTVMAFPAPCMANPGETVVMDVVMTLLGEGRSSRLYRQLREKKKLVSTISASYLTSKRPGLFLIYATHDADKLGAVRQATLEEIRRIRNERVGRRELAKAKKMLINDFYFANETTNGQSQSLGLYYILSGSEKYAQRYLREVARVSASDVRRVARRYLDPQKMVMVTLQPKPARAGEGVKR